eukprot:214607-Rhodomonas_salina.2
MAALYVRLPYKSASYTRLICLPMSWPYMSALYVRLAPLAGSWRSPCTCSSRTRSLRPPAPPGSTVAFLRTGSATQIVPQPFSVLQIHDRSTAHHTLSYTLAVIWPSAREGR